MILADELREVEQRLRQLETCVLAGDYLAARDQRLALLTHLEALLHRAQREPLD